MTALLLAVTVIAGIPLPVSRAITAFNGGDLYIRTIGMEPEGEFRRHYPTGVPDYAEGCESSAELDRELELWNTTILKLWEKVDTCETNFTVRTGEEYLIYENFILFYTSPGERVSITIHPEELWAVLSHCNRTPLPSTSQTSLEAWYPGLGEPVTAFVTESDPAMGVITELLSRGREAASAV